MTDKKRIGRKSKLTPELTERICDFIRKGNYISTACQIVGIHKATYYNWLEQGETDIEAGIDSMYADFVKAVKKAEADAEEELVKMVRNAAPKNWIAGMTLLERRHPDRWGRRDRHQVEVNETKVIHVTGIEIVEQDIPRGEIVEREFRELPEGKEDS